MFIVTVCIEKQSTSQSKASNVNLSKGPFGSPAFPPPSVRTALFVWFARFPLISYTHKI
jgi:hypothetical protein